MGLLQANGVLGLSLTMANSSSDFSQQPIVTIASGASIKVIADSTHCLQQCVQQQLSYLDNRARALASCAHFEAALRDAITMQELAPTLAAGYLCAGHVYSLQGREKAAIEICDQGLAVVPLSDPSYQQLVDARSMAQDKDKKTVDFIKAFPLDIIENIAPRILSAEEMAPSELGEYLGVSRVWREKLLIGVQGLHIGSTIENDLGDNDDLLVQVAPYCIALTLYPKAIGFTRLMSKVHFKSLHTLVLHAPDGVEEFNDTEIPKKTLASLPFLTHLTIRADYYNINLSDILNTCPNLVYLQADSCNDDMSTAPECHPRLKALLLWEYYDEFDIPEITKRLPALQVFVVNPSYESEDLKIVQDNCPNLKVIGLNDHRSWYGYVPSSMNHGDDRIGVHTLYINNYDLNWFSVNIKDIIECMKRNHHTLQHTLIYCVLPYNVVQDGNDTSELDHAIQVDSGGDSYLFGQMTNYEQYIDDQQALLMARWVIGKSPRLKKLKLTGCYGGTGTIDMGALFDDLTGLCELESITIDDVNADPSMDMGSIERFIQYQRTIDLHLHTLTLPKNTQLSNGVLEVLATLPRLENLGIHFPLARDEDPDGEHFSTFIHKLALGSPRLKYLKISSDGAIPDNIFIRLSELPIKTLNLYIPFYKTKLPLSLLSLLQCSQLENLCIGRFSGERDPSNDAIRNMLKIGTYIADENKLVTHMLHSRGIPIECH
ncbi:hypothetical protein K492DRAFT_218130 [Lichtheimia hyalospora FSU 10163]|nr:hypothetical protein K492DRAFT_218130 [Lichtheimia hyalospora FSU 10163]